MKMFPGLGGLNPKKMQAMMKQLGLNQEEIPALRVIIEIQDGTKIIIEEPSVSKISMQGQESFQISGIIKEEESPEFIEQDIKTIVEKTGATKEKAKNALEESGGDLAEAILKLNE